MPVQRQVYTIFEQWHLKLVNLCFELAGHSLFLSLIFLIVLKVQLSFSPTLLRSFLTGWSNKNLTFSEELESLPHVHSLLLPYSIIPLHWGLLMPLIYSIYGLTWQFSLSFLNARTITVDCQRHQNASAHPSPSAAVRRRC